MKKLFIAIITTLSLSFSVQAQITTEKLSQYSDSWNVKDFANSYTHNELEADNYEVLGTGNDGKNFQSIHAPIATEIYEYGAKFCWAELQHNNNRWTAWVESAYSCRVFCQEGHYGSKCEQTGEYYITENCGKEEDLKDVFKDGANNIMPWDNVDINNFGVDIDYVIVLPARYVGKYYIDVVPTLFASNDGKRGDDNKQFRKITELNQFGTQIFKLCAPGYVKSGGDCVRSTYCKKPDGGDNPLQCPTTRKQGWNANRTSCLNCNDYGRQWFYDAEKSECVNYKTSLSKMDMRIGPDNQECWQIKDKELYGECVLGK